MASRSGHSLVRALLACVSCPDSSCVFSRAWVSLTLAREKGGGKGLPFRAELLRVEYCRAIKSSGAGACVLTCRVLVE